MTTCRTVGLPSKSSDSSSLTLGDIGLSSGPAFEVQSLKPDPPRVLLEKAEPAPIAVIVDEVEGLDATPFIAARRAAICSFKEREDEAAEEENPFSGEGSLSTAVSVGVFRGDIVARVVRGEGGTVRAVVAEGFVVRVDVLVGGACLEVVGGFKELLDFWVRRFGDEVFDDNADGRAGVVNLLAPAAM